MNSRSISWTSRVTVLVAALVAAASVEAQRGVSTLDAAKARDFIGNWVLTINPQSASPGALPGRVRTVGPSSTERLLSIRDVDGKVAAEIGARGGSQPVTITDITMPASDLILKFKRPVANGRTTDVTLTLMLKNGVMTLTERSGGTTTTGTGAKQP